MTVEQICHIGKIELNDENTHIIKSYAEHIVPWLESDEFREKWASKAYPPLINPEKIDFEGANALHAWTLNIPFPKYYDFVVFGSHGVGITTAMNGYLWLCGAVPVGLSRTAKIDDKDEDEKPSNKANYVNMLKYLVLLKSYKEAQAKKREKNGEKEGEKMPFSHIYLRLNDFIADSDAKKLYSLIDASKALYIVRDPISNLKSLVNNPQMIKLIKYDDSKELQDFALSFDSNPKQSLEAVIIYPQGGSFEKKKEQRVGEGGEIHVRPCIDSIDYWMLDNAQTFHDGVLFNLLSGSLKNIKLKQTNDFIGQKAYDCMCDICEFFGISKPDESLAEIFSKRAANSVGFLPIMIYANNKTKFFDDSYSGDKFEYNDIKNSAKIILSSAMDPLATLSRYDISEYFADIGGFDENFMRLSADANSLVTLLAPNMMTKLRAYIKALIEAMDAVFKEHYKYRFSEDDVLEYFKAHPKSRQVFSYVLNQHLTFLRAHKPEIIANYTWYQKYLEIAKDDEPLDTAQNGVSVTNF